MTFTIKDGCIACDSCRPACPKEAIQLVDDGKSYWIDPTLCDDCADFTEPLCATICDVGKLVPLPSRKGRCKSTLLPAAIPDIFLNGKTNPFASSLVIWETCNILAQRQTLSWQSDLEGRFCYHRSVHRGRGSLQFRLAENPFTSEPMTAAAGRDAIAQFELRAACVHLIFAAYAVGRDRPWEEPFQLTSQHFEQYLGLDKRKDLTKLNKLTLIKDLVYQTCRCLVTVDWPRQGKVKPFHFSEHAIWQLFDTQYYFEEDAEGCRHLIGLSFVIQAGIWAQKFLNQQDAHHQNAFYQYSTLPQSLLVEIFSHWQQHEGSVRLLLWLLFKLRLGGDQRVTIRTLLSVAYGKAKLEEATTVRGSCKRLLKTFENDLEVLYYYGIKPLFDPQTYPLEIQPLWARVADIPEDAEAALDFWTEDANQLLSLTGNAPRNKWQRLLNARLQGFDLCDDWQSAVRRPPKRRRTTPASSFSTLLSAHEIKAARQRQSLSQRALAEQLNKSQSWIRDVEKGRFMPSSQDCKRLCQVLKIKLLES